MPQTNRPESSPDVLYSLAEIHERGLDPSLVPSCAVPKSGEVRGCPFALRCVFGKNENGGYGPKSSLPGTGGDGPENLAVYHEDAATGTALEKQMPCTAFMAGLYDRYVQQDRTRDVIVIVGGPGEKYQHEYLMPVDPNSNKTGDARLKLHQATAAVQPFREWRDSALDHTRREQILRMREGRRKLNQMRRMEKVGLADAEETETVPGVTAEPVASGRKRSGNPG